MFFLKSRQKNRRHAFLWLAFIYGTLPVARPICENLRQMLPFSLFINSVMMIALIVAVVTTCRRIPIHKLSSFFILGPTIFSYLSLLWIIKVPEERIHFLEYAILGVLIEGALRIEKKIFLTYVLTILLTSFLGWIDEVIQHYLPGRYFDWRDVLFNALGGILGIVLVFIVQRETTKETDAL